MSRSSELTHLDRAAAHEGEPYASTDMLAGLLMQHGGRAPAKPHGGESVPAEIYAVMIVTSLLTFATLRTVYEFLFAHQLYG